MSQASPNDRDAAAMAGHLGQVTQAGLPLSSGLRALSEEVPSRRMQSWLRTLAERLERGESLSDVLRRSDAAWPQYFVALIDAGQRANQLPALLSECVQLQRSASDLRRQRWIALAYPTILVLAAWFLVSFLTSLIAPQMRHVFLDFGVQLPLMTELILRATGVLEVLSWWFLPAVVMLSWLLWHAAPSLGLAWLRDTAVNWLPLWGELWRTTAFAEFSRLLSLLVRYRVPLPESIRLAASSVRDAHVRQACDDLAMRVERGESLAVAASQSKVFPLDLVNLFRWADRELEFADAMSTAAEVFDAKSRIQANSLAVISEPVTEVVIGLVVALTVISLFMPLTMLLSALS